MDINQQLTLFYVLIALFILNAIDCVTTYIALRKPGHLELNPIPAYFMAKYGLGLTMIWKIIIVGVLIRYAWVEYALAVSEQLNKVIFYGSIMTAIILLFVVISNIIHLMQNINA